MYRGFRYIKDQGRRKNYVNMVFLQGVCLYELTYTLNYYRHREKTDPADVLSRGVRN